MNFRQVDDFAQTAALLAAAAGCRRTTPPACNLSVSRCQQVARARDSFRIAVSASPDCGGSGG